MSRRTDKGLYVGYPLKHFPLRIHPPPPVVAAAAEGAGDQGKFRAMHHRLFEQMEQWSTGDAPDTALVRLARTSSWIGPSLVLV